ncbi:efflux RND transporter permease subunit, partial [Pseudomonas aeruginosa]
NAAVMFFMLDPFESRTSADLGALAIAGRLQARFASIPDGFLGVFPPPRSSTCILKPPMVPSPGTGGAGLEALARQTQVLMMKATESGQLGGLMTSFDINAPQLEVVVDRTKVKSQGVRLADVFEALQVYLGSLYINDFNRFGRTYKVTAQADAPHRMQAEAIGRLQVRNAAGAMLPLSSFVTVTPSSGPDRVIHYNGYPSADISG